MEEYVNLNTLVEDDISKMFKDSAICPLCLNILIEPIICMKCQKVFCKKCIENWKKKSEKCPNVNCNSPSYKECIGKKEILSILKFKCSRCGALIEYFEAKDHHDMCFPEKISKEIIEKEKDNENILPKMEKISVEEVQILKRKGAKIKNMTSKYNFILFKYYISACFGQFWCWKNHFNTKVCNKKNNNLLFIKLVF